MSDIPDKPDISSSASRARVPDYDLAETSDVDTAARLKAFADPTRTAILSLLLERAASTTELAVALDRPKGTIDHHLQVLAKADLIQVVRTRQVRAMTEKFWGRTARTFNFKDVDGAEPTLWFLREASEEMERSQHLGECGEESTFTFRHARIPAARAAEFTARLNELALEFVGSERGGDTVYGLLIALYATDHPTLPETLPETPPENLPETQS